jgi:multiple antibiotic resistance protein
VNIIAYIFLSFSSLFVIVDALGTIPAFLAMTVDDKPEDRIRVARLACTTAGGILLVMELTGMAIFRLFGISLPAFQIAGGLLLLVVANDMLRARRSAVQETVEEKEAGVKKSDVAITPLAVPMLAGPGAITTTIMLHNKAQGFIEHMALFVCIIGVCWLSYYILKLSAHGARWLNPMALKIMSRLMGLLLAALAVQFILNALRSIHVISGG